jgi:hypothetical protein
MLLLLPPMALSAMPLLLPPMALSAMLLLLPPMARRTPTRRIPRRWWTRPWTALLQHWSRR